MCSGKSEIAQYRGYYLLCYKANTDYSKAAIYFKMHFSGKLAAEHNEPVSRFFDTFKKVNFGDTSKSVSSLVFHLQ